MRNIAGSFTVHKINCDSSPLIVVTLVEGHVFSFPHVIFQRNALRAGKLWHSQKSS